MNFVLSCKAKNDLLNIARHTQKHWGREKRNQYLKSFDNTFLVIDKNPNIGKPSDYIKDAYRKLPHLQHVIYYKILEDNSILIVRILHQSMDVGRHLKLSTANASHVSKEQYKQKLLISRD